jgi:hypothetical protein
LHNPGKILALRTLNLMLLLLLCLPAAITHNTGMHTELRGQLLLLLLLLVRTTSAAACLCCNINAAAAEA